MDEYTRGEVAALVGPIMKTDPDNIQDAIIILVTLDGRLKMKGPAHTPEIIGNMIVTCLIDSWELTMGDDGNEPK